MITTERHILKNLQCTIQQLPDTATEKDHRFVIDATQAIISHLLNAEEPINNAIIYHKQARLIIEDIQQFMQHRSCENWRDHSTFHHPSYSPCTKKTVQNN